MRPFMPERKGEETNGDGFSAIGRNKLRPYTEGRIGRRGAIYHARLACQIQMTFKYVPMAAGVRFPIFC
jgi:hypothetical protein